MTDPASAYQEEANKHFRAGNIDKAIELYSSSLAETPKAVVFVKATDGLV